MNKQEYKHYLKTPHWQVLRAWRKMASDYKCEICGSEYRIEVHHLHYDTLFCEEFKDLKVLCHGCHTYLHELRDDIQKAIKKVNK